jgi:hypothetical protein
MNAQEIAKEFKDNEEWELLLRNGQVRCTHTLGIYTAAKHGVYCYRRMTVFSGIRSYARSFVAADPVLCYST